MFVPNTPEHIENIQIAKPHLQENHLHVIYRIVEKIMLINDVDTKWKLLLLMGIGHFASLKV